MMTHCIAFSMERYCEGFQVLTSLPHVPLSSPPSLPPPTSPGVWYSVVADERRYPPRATLEDSDRLQPKMLSLFPGEEEEAQHIRFHVQVRVQPRTRSRRATPTGISSTHCLWRDTEAITTCVHSIEKAPKLRVRILPFCMIIHCRSFIG